jgi:hypothetical protein
VKLVAQLGVDLERIVPVHAAEGQAVVGEQVRVGDVQARDRHRQVPADVAAHSQVEHRVTRQVARPREAVGQSGIERQVGTDEELPRQVRVVPEIQRVALIVVERDGGKPQAVPGTTSPPVIGPKQSAVWFE